ncbi:bifunctional riboflavin kinase/FMN adenylyltransferase [Buchnera aphidicola (Diuraphis noxia)]|uniref:Riboflavin biosynthesis protein n=1 Tax=Buchnera aphidicola subsp. Diuraphis noxia TaxID=118101 RepID=A0A1B2H852_BUCDN|nr:bifunctional riboflavin kinase/FAD synthetase [Buchnera aphidicola]ANZ22380.1 bifunctional riboflavin kinase/FMN adenylyltransferase [Buchnera aphidicola (Diuraphis noxia)]
MNIIRGIHNLKEIHANAVVTIGNFDGIHLGHQKLFLRVYKIGEKYNIPSIIILFEPQPLEFLKNKNAPIRITRFREKIKHIMSYNIDYILCIKFNKFFQSLTAKDFITKILINKLHIKFIIIGNDFRFGCQRSGNIDMLEKLSKKFSFKIIQVQPVYKNNIKISSTKIREVLSANNITLASKFLGRLFSIYGKVVHGKSIGKKIGYPTANILLNKSFLLSNGVYVVKVNCFLNKTLLGICNIGIKPSFSQVQNNRVLEVYLFNIKIDLYGKYIEVIILKKIRNELFFPSIQKLKNQIENDIKKAKQYFNISYHL